MSAEEPKPLALKALSNTLYSVVAYVWPMVFSILVTPIIVLKLGVGQYGLFVFITTVSGLLSLVSSGVNVYGGRTITQYHAQGNKEGIQKLVKTSNLIYLLIALAGVAFILGGFLLGSRVVPRSFSFSYAELLIFFSIAAANFFIQTSTSLFQLVPSALQRFDINSGFSIVNLTAGSVGNLVLVLCGFGIEALLLYQCALGIAMAVVALFISERLLPEASYRLGFDRHEFKKCLKLAGASSFNEFARTSLISLDRLLIPIFVGVSQLTYYTLPGNVSARIPGTADAFTGIIFPTATSLHSAGHMERLKSLYVRSSRLIMTVSLAIGITIIIYARLILRYWLNADFADHSTHVLIVLALTNLILSFLSPLASFFIGMNKIRFNTSLSFSMAILNIVALAALLPKWGIMGAAWAYFISVLPIFFAIYVIEKKYLDLHGRAQYYFVFVAKHALVGAVMYALAVFAFAPLIGSFVTLAVLGPLAVVAYFALYASLGFLEKDDARDLKAFVRAAAKRLHIYS